MAAVLPRVFHGIAMLCAAIIMVASVFLRSSAYTDFVSSFYVLSAGLAMLAAISSPRRGGVDFLVCFFFFVFMAVPTRLQYTIGIYPWFIPLNANYTAMAYGLCAASQFFYMLGISLSQARGLPARPGKTLPSLHNIPEVRFYSRWAWGIALAAILIALAAGPSALLTSRFGERNFGGMREQFTFISRSTSLLALVMMIYISRFAQSPALRRQNLWAALVFLPFFLVINYLPALPRFVLFGILIAIGCCYLDLTRPRTKALVFLAGVAVLLLVFPAIKALADENVPLSQILQNITGRFDRTILVAYMLRVDFDGFVWIAQTIEFLDRGIGGLRWGNNFLGVVLFFIPRALWPSKPIDTGDIVSTGMNAWYTNVSSPLPAEALMAFGLLGPLVLFCILGYAVNRIELRGARLSRRDTEMSAFFLYAILAGFILIIMRGALNGVAPMFASGFLAYAVMMFSRRNRLVWKAPPSGISPPSHRAPSPAE
ncbi:oligosaccharide repeat unit polymerase [Oceanicola sp. S124]|uniref:oligosaccharide repeat unit polymerase n=1 Tax=Oceanicola sp. S124 TaxID=1042378 RepID=UPI00025599BF|nr:oligosaccharide repeat unit polymerase [Oceanicola sp. S124]